MPYTMIIYEKKDLPIPEVGDKFEVTEIIQGVIDFSIGGGACSVVTLRHLTPVALDAGDSPAPQSDSQPENLSTAEPGTSPALRK